MGIVEDPKYFKLNVHLEGTIVATAKGLLRKFKNVFAWNYKEFKGIPPHIVEHKIELDTTIPPSYHVYYRMNPNYAMVVKQYLHKLLATDFIEPIEQKTWLSPIVVVPKNNIKLHICIDFRKLNATTRKDPYPLPFTDKVLDKVVGHEG